MLISNNSIKGNIFYNGKAFSVFNWKKKKKQNFWYKIKKSFNTLVLKLWREVIFIFEGFLNLQGGKNSIIRFSSWIFYKHIIILVSWPSLSSCFSLRIKLNNWFAVVEVVSWDHTYNEFKKYSQQPFGPGEKFSTTTTTTTNSNW